MNEIISMFFVLTSCDELLFLLFHGDVLIKMCRLLVRWEEFISDWHKLNYDESLDRSED